VSGGAGAMRLPWHLFSWGGKVKKTEVRSVMTSRYNYLHYPVLSEPAKGY
jgi:hypothetical protein